MFFRREQAARSSFSSRISKLQDAGFTVEKQGPGKVVATRGRCRAVIVEGPDGGAEVPRAGMAAGSEIAELVSLGYQTLWRTPRGSETAARADQLEAFHNFLEDLRELLGLTSLYNESLGTTHALHQYDRVSGRE